jgi:Kinesin-like protein
MYVFVCICYCAASLLQTDLYSLHPNHVTFITNKDGQTGSGKTHTIFGGNGNMITDKLNDELDGIIPRAVHDVFNHRNQIECGGERMKVQMSYLEIYNEEAKDLLSNDPSPPDLQIRDNGGDVIVQNLSYHSVSSPSEVARLVASAAEKRSTASTLMNAVSSRSHAICTLYINISPLLDHQESDEEIVAKLTLVDLAGSERAKKTGAEGTRLKEGININKGLFVLGQVVSSLAELGQSNASCDSGSVHVKYRDSKLTRLLQDSLGGKNQYPVHICVPFQISFLCYQQKTVYSNSDRQLQDSNGSVCLSSRFKYG